MALNAAAWRGDLRATAFLISQGVSLIDVEGRGLPLLLAVVSRECPLELIELLLDAGADVDTRDEHGRTPLLLALPHPAKLALLLGRGANPNLSESDGATPLIHAIAEARDESVRALEVAGAREDGRLDAELLLAVRRGERSSVERALASGADPNRRIGTTPLLEAIAFGHTELARMILVSGADPNRRAHDRLVDMPPGCASLPESPPPLHSAIELCRPELVDELIRAGADLFSRWHDAPSAFFALRRAQFRHGSAANAVKRILDRAKKDAEADPERRRHLPVQLSKKATHPMASRLKELSTTVPELEGVSFREARPDDAPSFFLSASMPWHRAWSVRRSLRPLLDGWGVIVTSVRYEHEEPTHDELATMWRSVEHVEDRAQAWESLFAEERARRPELFRALCAVELGPPHEAEPRPSANESHVWVGVIERGAWWAPAVLPWDAPDDAPSPEDLIFALRALEAHFGAELAYVEEGRIWLRRPDPARVIADGDSVREWLAVLLPYEEEVTPGGRGLTSRWWSLEWD